MGTKERIADIMVDADTQRAELAELESELQAEIKAIDRRKFLENRSLTDGETALRKDRRACQEKVASAYVQWAYLTAKRLDDSAEVEVIKIKIEAINLGLAEDLGRLKSVERYAAVAAKVAEGAVKVAEKLLKLAL